MLTETGGVLSLRELMQKFMDFAQRSDATTQSWELLDNRYDTFYGATFKIPMLQLIHIMIGCIIPPHIISQKATIIH